MKTPPDCRKCHARIKRLEQRIADLLGDTTPIANGALATEIIATIVARRFGLPPRRLFDRRRDTFIAWPRQVAIYLIRNHTNFDGRATARYFGLKDHKTAYYACKTVENRRDTEPRTTGALLADLDRQITQRLSQ